MIRLTPNLISNDIDNRMCMAPIQMIGPNKFINTAANTGELVNLTPQTSIGFKYAIVECMKGDAFTINADGGQSSRIWCFIDSTNKVISKNEFENSSVRGLIIYAPENAAKLIINDKGGNISYKGDYLQSIANSAMIANAISRMNNIEEVSLNLNQSYYISTNGVRTYGKSWSYAIFDATAGDYILANVAGMNNVSAIFEWINNTYVSLVNATDSKLKAYLYEVPSTGKYGVSSNSANPTTVYILHKNVDKTKVDLLENNVDTNTKELNRLEAISSDLFGLTSINMIGLDQYIETSGEIGSVIDFTPKNSVGFKYAIVDCNPGDIFTISGSGGNKPRVWCFVNNNDEILLNNEYQSASVKKLILTAPLEASKLIINDNSGSISYKGNYYTEVINKARKALYFGKLSNMASPSINYTAGYYINSSGVRTYNISWKYGFFDAMKDDIILVVTAGIIDNTSSVLFSYDGANYTSIVESITEELYPYIYEVTANGRFGINSNQANPTEIYIMHKNADKKDLLSLENNVGYIPNLIGKDLINRFSTNADMLLTSKIDWVYHDNFNRADVYNEIGYNFVEGNYIDKYDTMFPVGINNKCAYSSNPNNVTGKHYKLFDAQKFPYVVSFSAPDEYTASLTINYIDINTQTNIRIMGGANDRYIRLNYLGKKPEVNLYDQYRKFTRVTVCVWTNHYDIYLDGRYFKTIEEDISSTLCGMMFSTGANYRYNWFSVGYPSKFEELGFDDIIEKYGLIGKGYTNETGNQLNGIVLSTETTLDSDKSIRFRLNRNDDLSAGSKRSEIGLIQRKKYNLSNKIYSFDIYFDSDYQYDSLYEIIFQLHTFADDDNYAGLVPSTSLTVQKNKVIFAIRGQSDKAIDNEGSINTSKELFEIETERWYHFLIYQREAYDKNSNPLTICFVDGQCKFYSEEINAYNVDNGTYPKWGIYKTPWKDQTSETTERTIFVDNIHVWS